MRVDQREAVAALQVLERHVLQERRFARAGLADDVNMRKPVFVLNAEDPLIAVKIDAGETRDVIRAHTGAYFPPRPAIWTRQGVLPQRGQQTFRVS